MSAHIDFKKHTELNPIVSRETACENCGCTNFREVNRIAGENGKQDSVMYECVECGEYRL
ncbi:MAG: hypothetical protein KF835_10110 [Xanthobacteraceae bacterium]|nr:hypothetical protein [Xanthobacteraceae bacterium]